MTFQFNVGPSKDGFKILERPSICFGGIAEGFCHAEATEKFLTGKSLKDASTIRGAMETLENELHPHPAVLEADPQYRKNLAQGLLFKTILGILNETLDERVKSGATNIARSKEVSKGSQMFKTDSDLWPMNKGLPKLEGKAQCTGEAEFIDDIPTIKGELHAAVVQAKQANCDLDVVDPSRALVILLIFSFLAVGLI